MHIPTVPMRNVADYYEAQPGARPPFRREERLKDARANRLINPFACIAHADFDTPCGVSFAKLDCQFTSIRHRIARVQH